MRFLMNMNLSLMCFALLVFILPVLLPYIFLLRCRSGWARWRAWCSRLPWRSSWCIALIGLQRPWHKIQLQLMTWGCHCLRSWSKVDAGATWFDVKACCASSCLMTSCPVGADKDVQVKLLWCLVIQLDCWSEAQFVAFCSCKISDPDVVTSSGLWWLVAEVLLQVLWLHSWYLAWRTPL